MLCRVANYQVRSIERFFMNPFRHFCLTLLALGLVQSPGNIVVAQQVPQSLYQEMHWRVIGPFRGGRTRAACGVVSQPNVFYVGQVNGGVWKTDDYGGTGTPIFDGQPTQA